MMQEFVQRSKDLVDECLSDVHTAVPGEIVSVDTSTGLATVKPIAQMVMDDDTLMDYPEIDGVPIVFPQGNSQKVSITFPVKKGDGCLLIIAEQSLEYWLYDMETDSDLQHDLTNAICIPGLFKEPPDTFKDSCEDGSVIINTAKAKVMIEKESVSVDANGTKIDIDSGVKITGNVSISGNLSVSGSISATGRVSGSNI